MIIQRSRGSHRGLRIGYQLIEDKKNDAAEDKDAKEESTAEYSGLLNNLAWLLSTSTQDSVRDGKRSWSWG